MSDATPTARLLARHAERRRQGLATVSVLTGPPAASAAAWRAAAGGRAVLTLTPADVATPPAVVAACVGGACRAAPLLTAAVTHVARRLGRPPADVLAGKSAHDLDHLWRILAATAGTPDGDDADVLTACRLVCGGTPDRWPADLSAALPGWRAVAAVDRLLAGAGRWPPVWVAVAADDPGGRSLAAVAGPLVTLAEAVPRWPVGVGTSSAAVDAAFAASLTRAATLLLRVDVRGTDPP